MNKYNILNYFNNQNRTNDNEETSSFDNISNIKLDSKVLFSFFKEDCTNNYKDNILLKKTYVEIGRASCRERV